MIELPLIFVAGFLGSSHCIGMCGPFAILLGTAPSSWKTGLLRQLIYSAGRVFTYSVLGATAAFCGVQLESMASQIVNIPAVLSFVAGCFLIYQGLLSTGFAGFFKKQSSGAPCHASGVLRQFLKSSAQTDVFLAGVFTGFLPCGLVYGILGMAGSTRNIGLGMVTMAVFGIGTIPIMVATGFGGKLLSVANRRRILRLAAWCMIVAGVLAVVRGVYFFNLTTATASPIDSCPFCP